MKDYNIKIKGKKDFIEKFKEIKGNRIKIIYSRQFSKIVDSKNKEDIIKIMESQLPKDGEELYTYLKGNNNIIIARLINLLFILFATILSVAILTSGIVVPYIITYLIFTLGYYKYNKVKSNNVLKDLASTLYFMKFKDEILEKVKGECLQGEYTYISSKTYKKLIKILDKDGEFNMNNISILSSNEKMCIVNQNVFTAKSNYYLSGLNIQDNEINGIINNQTSEREFSFSFNKPNNYSNAYPKYEPPKLVRKR